MSTEEGYVTGLKGNRALVHVKRSGMCEVCSSKDTCYSLGGDSDMEAEAVNTIKANVGDRVLIKISSKSALKITTLFYLLPVFFLLLGSIIGYKIVGDHLLTPEIASLILGIAACMLSFIIIKLIANRLKGNKKYIPEIIKIL